MKRPRRSNKATYGNVYANKPIFRRKLIEKYSTARYNFNTKIVLKKNLQTRNNESCTQSKRECERLPKDNGNETRANFDDAAAIECDKFSSPNREYDDAFDDAEQSSLDALAASIACETSMENLGNQPNNENADHSVPLENALLAVDAGPGSMNSVDEKGVLLSEFSEIDDSKRTSVDGNSGSGVSKKQTLAVGNNNESKHANSWKIAPKNVYDRLWETSVGKYEIKQEPKKEIKRRKKGHRKKASTNVKNRVESQNYTDPYVDCMSEFENSGESICRNRNDKVGVVMYLGVNRPLFPLIYRNVRLLNGDDDAYITGFWSEFALSTLVTKNDDKKCAPVLVSVKDAELLSLISELDEQCVDAKLSNVGVAVATPCDDDVVEAKYQKDALFESGNSRTIKTEYDATVSVEKLPRQQRKQPHPQQLLAITTDSMSYGLRSTRKKHDEQKESVSVSLSKKSLCTISPSSKEESRPAVEIGDEKLQESQILKQFGYKECVVAIPKLGDAQIRAIFDGNEVAVPTTQTEPDQRAIFDGNEVAVPTTQTERDQRAIFNGNEVAVPIAQTECDELEEYHFFGASKCTRTYGIMVNYNTRNRTLVHYYKLKKMLDFQKSNNKYFMCCDYVLIDRVETPDDVDVTTSSTHSQPFEETGESEVAALDSNGVTSQSFRMYSAGVPQSEFQPRLRRSRNPNDIFNYTRIKEFKDRSSIMSSVKTHKFKSIRDLKWISLKLDKSIVAACYANQYVMRNRLLFEVVYRAELSKKVICSEIEPSKNVEGLTFGVYAFPGICELVYIGPYAFHENHRLSGSIRLPSGDVVRAQIKTVDEKENFPQPHQPFAYIDAEWWWPNSKNQKDLNDHYLEFVFNPSSATVAPQFDKFNLSKILSDHECINYHTYEISGKEQNFVLFHDVTNTLQNAQKADSVPARPRRNHKTKDRNSSSFRCCGKRTKECEFDEFDEFERREHRKRCKINSTVNSMVSVHTMKNGVLRLRKRSRYHPVVHIENERMRRLEFKNNKLQLASELRHHFPVSITEPLVSIIKKSTELIERLECDTLSVIEQGKMLRKKQTLLMKKYLFLLQRLDHEDVTYKRGVDFIANWEQRKMEEETQALHNIAVVDKEKPKRSKSKFVVKRRNNQSAEMCSKNEIIVTSEENLLPAITTERDVGRIFEKVPSTAKKPKKCNLRGDNGSREMVDKPVVLVKLDGAIRTRNTMQEIAGLDITRPHLIDSSVVQHLDENLPPDDKTDAGPSSNNVQLEENPRQPIRRRRRRQPWSRRSKLSQVGNNGNPRIPDPLGPFASSGNTVSEMSVNHFVSNASLIGAISARAGKSRAKPINSPYLEHSYCTLDDAENSFTNRFGKKCIENTECGESLALDQITGEPDEEPNFRAVVKEKSTDQVSIDIMENNHIFARLNIAKVRNQGDSGSSSNGSMSDDSKQKIFALMTRILAKMQQTSAGVPNEAQPANDQRGRLLKRALLVRKLKSLISRFEHNKRRERMYENVESIEISDDEYDPLDEDDPMQDDERNVATSSGNICNRNYSHFFEKETDNEASEKETDNEASEEEVEEEIILQEDEYDGVEEQVIDASGATVDCETVTSVSYDERVQTNGIENVVIEEVFNDVDDDDNVTDNPTSTVASNESDSANNSEVVIRSFRMDDNLKFIPIKNATSFSVGSRRFVPIFPKSCTGNVVIYPKHKKKFVPNIIKVAQRKENFDDLFRIKVKSASSSSVILPKTSENGFVDEIISRRVVKRTWCSPVTNAETGSDELPVTQETDEGDIVKQRQNDTCDSLCKTNAITDDSEANVDRDDTNRICIKSFACVGKFDEAFPTNVDRLLNPL